MNWIEYGNGTNLFFWFKVQNWCLPAQTAYKTVEGHLSLVPVGNPSHLCSCFLLLWCKNKQKPCSSSSSTAWKTKFSYTFTEELQGIQKAKLENLFVWTSLYTQDLNTTSGGKDVSKIHFHVAWLKSEKCEYNFALWGCSASVSWGLLSSSDSPFVSCLDLLIICVLWETSKFHSLDTHFCMIQNDQSTHLKFKKKLQSWKNYSAACWYSKEGICKLKSSEKTRQTAQTTEVHPQGSHLFLTNSIYINKLITHQIWCRKIEIIVK